MTAFRRLVQELILSHQRDGHQVFLVSSPVDPDGVAETGEQITRLLSDLYEGSVYFLGASEESPDALQKSDLSGLRNEYDLLVVAVPDLLEDGAALACLTQVDAAVLVVRAETSTRQQVKQSMQQLNATTTPLVYAVLHGGRERIPRWLRKKFRRAS